MITHDVGWPIDSMCVPAATTDLAREVYERVCRTDFETPGFCVVRLDRSLDSVAFRGRMVALKDELSAIHEARTANTLVYLSATRFDQQESTRPHLDSGPDECMLMLGYEPSEVAAELAMVDYAKCAFDLGLTPKEFMARHNPMFGGAELLEPYVTRVPCFSPTDYSIVCINNSAASYSASEPAWQGVLHTATIAQPDDSERRIVNSTLIASVPKGTSEPIDESRQQEFVETPTIHRRGYDKPHLAESP